MNLNEQGKNIKILNNYHNSSKKNSAKNGDRRNRNKKKELNLNQTEEPKNDQKQKRKVRYLLSKENLKIKLTIERMSKILRAQKKTLYRCKNKWLVTTNHATSSTLHRTSNAKSSTAIINYNIYSRTDIAGDCAPDLSLIRPQRVSLCRGVVKTSTCSVIKKKSKSF